MLRSSVGAVQPVAVTRRSHSIVPPVAELDSLDAAVAPRPHDAATRAGVDDAGDLHPGPLEVGHGGIALAVGAEDDRTLARPDREEADEAPDSRRQHHPGQVVAGKDVRALDEAGGDDERLGPCLHEPLHDVGQAPLHDGHPVVVVAPRDGRVDEHLDGRSRRHSRPQPRQLCQLGRAAVAEMAAELVLLLDEHHPGALLRSSHGRCHAGRPTAGDEDVGVGVALVVARRAGCRADTSPPAAKRCSTFS